MVEFCLAISIRIIDPIINDPKLVQFRIDIHTGHDAVDAVDDAMCVSAVLTSHQLNIVRKVLVCNRIIENNKPFWALNHLILNILPGQFRAKLSPAK